ncbi:MAG: superoxide dismutase [Caulobacteraceae bacterium]|nr:superoxide dismutase [Caulobacteraceae bacterium]
MFELPPLPYDYTALEPKISETTLRTHHGKHHKAYVDNTNKFLADAGETATSLEAVIRDASAGSKTKLFNNSAQVWNHAFFWECMTPSYAAPSGELAAAIDAAFGSLAALKEKFVAEGVGHFASGWAWIVYEDGALRVLSTHDAATEATRPGVTPILLCDVWEHAYYLDYKNDRKSFVETFFDGLANWDFAAKQLAAAKGQGTVYSFPAPK